MRMLEDENTVSLQGMVRAGLSASAMTVAIWAAAITGAAAQEAPASNTLPGGASSLTETHGDWTVSYQLGQQSGQTVRVCVLSQQQADNRGQRALVIELHPVDDGATGVLVLPSGWPLPKASV